MTESSSSQVTTLLQRVNQGEAGALNDLMTAVYGELRDLARRHLEREFGRGLAGITLQPTALVNETFLQLIKQRQNLDNRGHFFAIATKLMLRVLIDYQRQRGALKRGGGWVRVSLDPDRHDETAQDEHEDLDVSKLAAAMEKLEELDSRKANVVKLRVLFGLSIAEVAESLGVGRATIDRDWAFARAWLANELAEG